MKSKQFCSVCKEWLNMEVVPTSDGEDDDGVIWFRCPQCQGFLPKLGGGESREDQEQDRESTSESKPFAPDSESEPAGIDDDAGMAWDSPADMMAAERKERSGSADPDILDDDAPPPLDPLPELGSADLPEEIKDIANTDQDDPEVDPESGGDARKTSEASTAKADEPPEPVLEYAALLATKDFGEARPYRPWETYEIGSCIHHLAWGDCGVVVAKETLPGGREIIKCFFEEAGVVRLIEKATR